MSGLHISQHAAQLIGQRAHAGDIRIPHQQLVTSLERAAGAARALGIDNYLIKIDAVAFLVRHRTVVTLVHAHAGYARAAILADRRGHRP